MKRKFFLIFYFSMGLCSYSQTIQLGIGGGSTIVTGKDFYTNELDGLFIQETFANMEANSIIIRGLGFYSEFNFNLKIRLICEKLPVNFYNEVGYTRFIGDGTMMVFQHPLSSSLPAQFKRTESRCNLINSSFGIEYKLLDKGITSFFSSGFMVNYFNDIKIESMDGIYKRKAMDGGLRYGMEAGISFYYAFTKSLSLGLSSKYALNNLFGRKENEEQMNTVKTNAVVLYEL